MRRNTRRYGRLFWRCQKKRGKPMGIIRSLNALDPAFLPAAEEFVGRLKEARLGYTVVETLRTPAVHLAYWSQGREPLEAVNEKRTKAGLWLIGEADNKKTVTQTMKSVHLEGKALDVAPLLPNGTIPWNISTREIADLWKRFGEIGRAVGLEWGGEWKPLDRWGVGWDPPHYQARGA
jgi:peptidoglycan L-alanyl-D-glutamate endopeptidase CwlK